MICAMPAMHLSFAATPCPAALLQGLAAARRSWPVWVAAIQIWAQTWQLRTWQLQTQEGVRQGTGGQLQAWGHKNPLGTPAASQGMHPLTAMLPPLSALSATGRAIPRPLAGRGPALVPATHHSRCNLVATQLCTQRLSCGTTSSCSLHLDACARPGVSLMRQHTRDDMRVMSRLQVAARQRTAIAHCAAHRCGLLPTLGSLLTSLRSPARFLKLCRHAQLYVVFSVRNTQLAPCTCC